jgi:excisionase family DNA binding protein
MVLGEQEKLSGVFLSVEDVMKLMKVSRSMVYALTFREVNPLPSVKLGRSRRYPEDRVRAWIKELRK